MDRRIFHGNIKPNDIAHALMAEFNRGNMHAQVLGNQDKMAVQIATGGCDVGGQTALPSHPDGGWDHGGKRPAGGWVSQPVWGTQPFCAANPFSLLGG
jgi:hypothetical protein